MYLLLAFIKIGMAGGSDWGLGIGNLGGSHTGFGLRYLSPYRGQVLACLTLFFLWPLCPHWGFGWFLVI